MIAEGETRLHMLLTNVLPRPAWLSMFIISPPKMKLNVMYKIVYLAFGQYNIIFQRNRL